MGNLRGLALRRATYDVGRWVLLQQLTRPVMRPLCAALPAGTRRGVRAHARVVDTIRTVVRPDWNCIDVGAYRGDVLRAMVRAAPLGQHHAFEPLPHAARLLRARFPGVCIHENALGEEAGEVSFVHVVSRPTYSGLRERAYPAREELVTIRVEQLTLDSSLPAGNSVQFIKIDVEGAEMLVLRGARRTIATNRPVVLFDYGLGASDRYDTTADDVVDFFAQFEMDIYDTEGDGPLDAASMGTVPHRWDFVAVPREAASSLLPLSAPPRSARRTHPRDRDRTPTERRSVSHH